jgi:hypothetical protein
MEPMKKKRGLFATLILLTAALACVIPGTQTASTIPPTPDTRLGTMVAETVSAAVELTALAVPTETPPPTATPEPTVTPTPEISGAGSTLTAQDDGSTLFVDERAGYQLTVPTGWLAVRVNEQEYFDAFQLSVLANERLQSTLQSIQTQDPNTFRLLVVDIDEEHIQNDIVTNVNLIWDPQTVISFESEEELQAIAAELPAAVNGLTVSSVNIIVPLNGAPYGEIQSEISGLNTAGVPVTLYQKMTVFNLKTGALVITFTHRRSALPKPHCPWQALPSMGCLRRCPPSHRSPTPRPTGLFFEELPGNGTKVWDYDSGYVLVLSGEWVLIPTDKDDLRNAIRDLSSLDQDMANSLRNMDLLNDDSIRLIFVSQSPKYRNRELLPNMISFSFQDPVIRNAHYRCPPPASSAPRVERN